MTGMVSTCYAMHATSIRTEKEMQKSMQRLSAYDRLVHPGDDPSDFVLSNSYRNQMHSLDEKNRAVENLQNCVHTADSWLQQYQDITTRLCELSVSSCDDSKSPNDRKIIQQEHIQLKAELSKIAAATEYNRIKICGGDQMLTYDSDRKTFAFVQMDGTEQYHLSLYVAKGVQSKNEMDFLIDETKPYTLSGDGRNIFYVNSLNQLSCYEIDANTLSVDSRILNSPQLHIDDENQFWCAEKNGADYTINNIDIEKWGKSNRTIDIADMSTEEFKIYQNRMYYCNNDRIVSRNLFNTEDCRLELDTKDLNVPLNTTQGEFALSFDGQYFADVMFPGVIRVMHMPTQKITTMNTGCTNLANLSFSVDNREVVFLNKDNNTPYALPLTTYDTLSLRSEYPVIKPQGNQGFSSLSLQGGSNRAHLFTPIVSDSFSTAQFVQMPDLRLNKLGIATTDLSTPMQAREALSAFQKANDRINIQRSIMGAQEESLTCYLEAATTQADNLGKAYANIRDPNIAKEVGLQRQNEIQLDITINLFSKVDELQQRAIALIMR